MENELRHIIGEIRASGALIARTERYVISEIGKRNRSRPRARLRLAAVSSALLLLITLSGISSYLFFTPAAYVDMDVNPSIGLTLNHFGRIIDTHSYNGDGAAVLNGVNVRFKTYGVAVEILLDAIISNGYLSEDGLVSVTVQSDDDAGNALITQLERVVSVSLQKHHANARADIFPVTDDVRTDAQARLVSPAMYIAISELQGVDPTATFESCAGHSITQIRARTRAHHGGGRHGGRGNGRHQ